MENRPGMIDHPVEMLATLTECIDALLETATRDGD